MTQDEAEKAQQWKGMDGAIAWHLIERHADGWEDIGAMMNSWLRANVLVEREACANICDHEQGTAGDAADKIRSRGKNASR